MKTGTPLRLCTLTVGTLALAACRMDTGVEDLVDKVPTQTSLLGQWVKSTDPRCAGAGPSTSPSASVSAAASPGHVVFRLPDGHDYRIEARAGARPEDLTRELDAIAPGIDGFVNASADGQWLLVQTTRFGCGQDMCTAIVDRTACTAQVIVTGREAVHPEATSAIGARGEVVVFPAEGNHASDLFAMRRVGYGWDAPVNVTAASHARYNKQPTLSPDGTRLLFDCGEDPGAGPGTAVCEVGIDGKNFRVAIEPNAVNGKSGANHHASYSPDGSIVFEGTWNGGAEQIWKVEPGKVPALVNVDVDPEDATRPRFSDDNSPCVLPDGRIVSLWLGRKEEGKAKRNSGHELKIMNADGTGGDMLLTGVDVVDIGIGCAR